MGLDKALDRGLTLFLCPIRSHGLRDDLVLEIHKSVAYYIEADVLCKLRIKVIVHPMHHSIF